MVYYDALISKWATLTTSGTTAAEQVNAMTVTGPAVPMIIPTYRIYNLIVDSEFAALSEQLIRNILSMATFSWTDALHCSASNLFRWIALTFRHPSQGVPQPMTIEQSLTRCVSCYVAFAAVTSI
ncbi:hypothetical protein [Mesorhizobium huakuii]|uniref:Uncharacterized protein n=1 Tax=Mesorhizobium huakuii TaxID=28104 RepID=A0A7G6T1D0_9HYPH|nr:hypothetical protein [Mesorhizobium huakuii]QND60562.1 hypothetical protein HB778_31495 [Mesorhizobium huakuii]